MLRELAVVLDRDPARLAARQLERETAEARRERDERAQHLEVLGADRRDVDRVRHEAALERGDHLLGDDHPRPVLGLVGRSGEVRRRDQVRGAEQRPRIRLLGEDVDRGAGDLARGERLEQRRVVDQLATGGVDDPGAVLHAGERPRVDHVARLVVQRQVERHEVGPREHAGERVALDPGLAETVGGDERVVRDDAHLQPERAAGDLLPDPPVAEDPERLLRELDPAPLRALPAPRHQRGVRLRDVPRQRHEQADRVLGGRDDVRLGGVRDDDAASGRRLDVDVVDTDARPADHLEARRPLRSGPRSASSPSG